MATPLIVLDSDGPLPLDATFMSHVHTQPRPSNELHLLWVCASWVCLLSLTLAACGGDGGVEIPAADPGTHPATAAAETMYHHMAAGDFTGAARILSDDGIAQLGGLELAAERLKSTNPAMIHHGGISSMSSTVSPPEDLGVKVSTTVAFKDGTLDEMQAWMKQVDGVWKMSI